VADLCVLRVFVFQLLSVRVFALSPFRVLKQSNGSEALNRGQRRSKGK
jgi:hypothetical protein